MQNGFLTYQKFSDRPSAIEVSEILTENGVEWEIEDASAVFDASFANNAFDKEFRIKIKKEDFERADQLFLDLSAAELENIDKDYYLLEFTNEELRDLLSKSDEWSKFDYLLAQKLLKDRGEGMAEEELMSLKEERITELSKPEKSQRGWIIAGYIFAFGGGILGLLIGWNLRSHKKTLPNGERVYSYSEEDRKSGKSILIIAIVFFTLSVLFQIVYGGFSTLNLNY